MANSECHAGEVGRPLANAVARMSHYCDTLFSHNQDGLRIAPNERQPQPQFQSRRASAPPAHSRRAGRQLRRRTGDGDRRRSSRQAFDRDRRSSRAENAGTPLLFPGAASSAMRAGEAAGLGRPQETQGRRPVRGPRCRRQGRRDQTDHAAVEPAGLPRCRAAGAERARTHPMVFSTLYLASAGRRRNRAVRPQLVQPRRRRAGDGILHATPTTKSSSIRFPNSSACWCDRASC